MKKLLRTLFVVAFLGIMMSMTGFAQNNTEAEVQVPWADYSEIGTDAQWFDVITGQAVDPAHLSVAAKNNIILQTR